MATQQTDADTIAIRDTARSCDIAILGGGLAGGLIALAFAARRPELDVRVIERGETLGGHHVWSFFASDAGLQGDALLAPLVEASWAGYDVRFPGLERHLDTPYRSMTSHRLDAAVRAALPAERVLSGAEVIAADATCVTLADGRTLHCGAVIDARGAHAMPHLTGGWQKFLGQTLRIPGGHGLVRPIVMDATVSQFDGYRFIYCLPFSPDEVFVEDTYYSDTPHLATDTLRQRIAEYAGGRGWRVEAVTYEETGVLPVIAGGDYTAFCRSSDAPPRAGVRAALVHPLTSYSVPDALRFALHLAGLDNLCAQSLGRACDDYAEEHWRRGRFYRMLSRMLFGAAEPAQRWRMLARFYALPQALIERFYAGRSTLADQARILAGRPPVPVLAAVASLAGRGRPLASLDPSASGTAS